MTHPPPTPGWVRGEWPTSHPKRRPILQTSRGGGKESIPPPTPRGDTPYRLTPEAGVLVEGEVS